MKQHEKREAIHQFVRDAGYRSLNAYAIANKTATGATMSSAGIRYNIENGCRDIDALQNYASTLGISMGDIVAVFNPYCFLSHIKKLGFRLQSNKNEKVQQYIKDADGVAIAIFVKGSEVSMSSSIQDKKIGKGGRDYKLPFIPYMKQMTVDIINALSTPVVND